MSKFYNIYEKTNFTNCSGVQKQLQVCRGQEEQDRLQGLQAQEVSHGRDVKVWMSVRPPVKLVQDPLSHAEDRRQGVHGPLPPSKSANA